MENEAKKEAKKEAKVSKEIAIKDFETWAEENRIEYDEDDMTEEDKACFVPLKTRIVKAIRDGRCIVDGGHLKYTIQTCERAEGLIGREVEIGRPYGGVFTGMDGYKETQTVHRLNGAMSAMTGLDVGIFAKLDAWDYTFFTSVAKLFLTI